jgi:hypothetical protein
MVPPGQIQHQLQGLPRVQAGEGLNLFEAVPQSDPPVLLPSMIFLDSLKSLPIALITPQAPPAPRLIPALPADSAHHATGSACSALDSCIACRSCSAFTIRKICRITSLVDCCRPSRNICNFACSSGPGRNAITWFIVPLPISATNKKSPTKPVVRFRRASVTPSATSLRVRSSLPRRLQPCNRGTLRRDVIDRTKARAVGI